MSGVHWDLLPSFAAFGLSTGAVFALMAIGLVIIHRASGVLNFAHGSMAMVATVVYALTLHHVPWMPPLLAAVPGVATGAGLGAAAYLGLFRRMAESSVLARILVSLALAGALQGLVTPFDLSKVARPPLLVTAVAGHSSIALPGGAALSWQELLVVLAAVLSGAAVSYLLSHTTFGIALRAVAQNRDAARMLGIREDRVALAAWTLGGALAAVAGILVIPLGVLTSVSMTGYMVAGLVAAVVGGFVSVPAAMLGGVVLGVVQETLQAVDALSDHRLLVGAATIVLLLVVRVDRRFVPEQETATFEGAT